MAKLIKCNSCKKEVAITAKACPNCGDPKFRRGSRTFLDALILFVVMPILIVSCFIGIEKSKEGEIVSDCAPKECAFKKHFSDFNWKCQVELESAVKYDYEWTNSWFESRWPRYDLSESGVLTLAGNKIKLQNGFGAWSIHEYVCKYNINTKEVIVAGFVEN